MKATLSIRVDADNPLHHLWNNGGTWWIHYTVHTDDGRKRRVRYSLGTAAVEQARVLRDAVFAAWIEPPEPPAATPEARPAGKVLPGARVEVAGFDGFGDPCWAPVPASDNLLARIDRGANLLGTLVDSFYVTVDRPWESDWMVLWNGIDPTQTEIDGFMIAVARMPLVDLFPEDSDEADVRAGAALLLHAWIRYARKTSEQYAEDDRVEGGELLDAALVQRVLECACQGRALDLGRARGEERP